MSDSSSGSPSSPSSDDKEAERIYREHLKQSGQLIEVDWNTDLSKLDPSIIYVEYPDHSLKRVGFS
jgi:hypothetical protein